MLVVHPQLSTHGMEGVQLAFESGDDGSKGEGSPVRLGDSPQLRQQHEEEELRGREKGSSRQKGREDNVEIGRCELEKERG